MGLNCAGNRLADAWMQRYPEIAFLSIYGEVVPYQKVVCDEDVAAWRASLDLAQVDILYVFGVGVGAYYPTLKPWLNEKPERMVIFLEDDLSLIATFSQLEASLDFISDSQVSLHLIQDSKELPEQLKALIRTYPAQRIEVAALSQYAQTRASLFKQIRMTLLRESSVSDATLTDTLYSHYLVSNVLANMKRWPGSFLGNGLKNKFKNVPAIICGAGPSLSNSISLLQTLQERALIIAGGSTITALSNQGIIPHLGLAFDPNPEEYSRLRVSSAFEMPLLYGTRLQAETFQTCSGPFGYLRSQTGGPCEAYFEQEMKIDAAPIGPELGPEAFSVTTLAVALAVEMGCSPIILNGVDLAYTGMQRYAEGVMPSSRVCKHEMAQEKRALETLLRRKGVKGKMVYTLVKWVMESSCISNYAKAHPHTQFINVSEEGLGFKGIPNCSLSQAVQQHCQISYDLRSWVHAEIQSLDMTHITSKHIQSTFAELESSLGVLEECACEMISELKALASSSDLMTRSLPTGMMTLLQLNCEEERAFACFFPQVGPAIDQVLNRSYPLPLETDTLFYREKLIERLIVKWERLEMMIKKKRELVAAHLIS